MSEITKTQMDRVLQQYAEICNSAENERNRQFWTHADQPWLIERWRGISARRTGAPFTMALDIAGYSTVVGIACPAYYESAEAQLYGQLRSRADAPDHGRHERARATAGGVPGRADRPS